MCGNEKCIFIEIPGFAYILDCFVTDLEQFERLLVFSLLYSKFSIFKFCCIQILFAIFANLPVCWRSTAFKFSDWLFSQPLHINRSFPDHLGISPLFTQVFTSALICVSTGLVFKRQVLTAVGIRLCAFGRAVDCFHQQLTILNLSIYPKYNCSAVLAFCLNSKCGTIARFFFSFGLVRCHLLIIRAWM